MDRSPLGYKPGNWGSYPVQITISLKSGRKISLKHQLILGARYYENYQSTATSCEALGLAVVGSTGATSCRSADGTAYGLLVYKDLPLYVGADGAR